MILPNFTFNNSNCDIVFELSNSTMGASLDPVFTYDNASIANVYTLSIDTDQVTATTVYDLIFDAYYLNSNKTQTIKYINLQVTVYNCLDAILTPPTYTDQYYNISDS